MFWNIYSKRVLCGLREKESMFWTWIFPLLLSTMFFFTFTSLDTVGQLRAFPLGVVDDAAYHRDAAFRSALESVSGEDGLFELTAFGDAADADAALVKGEIEGYILAGEPPALIVTGDDINQTIAKGFLDRYLQTRNSVALILASNPGAVNDLPALLQWADYTKEISLAQNPPSNRISYFYALLAMVCLYGGFQGLITVVYLQANLSPLGARRTVAPLGNWGAAVCDLLGGLTVHLTGVIVVVAYIVFVLGTDFGSKLWLVLLTCLAGSLLGVAFGAMIAAMSKFKEQVKIAILITFCMVCSFLSGLMVQGVNYIVAEHAAMISWLNPAARIADSFYCLYYYDTYDRYLLNLGIILAMTVVFFTAASLFLRRQRYESI